MEEETQTQGEGGLKPRLVRRCFCTAAGTGHRHTASSGPASPALPQSPRSLPGTALGPGSGQEASTAPSCLLSARAHGGCTAAGWAGPFARSRDPRDPQFTLPLPRGRLRSQRRRRPATRGRRRAHRGRSSPRPLSGTTAPRPPGPAQPVPWPPTSLRGGLCRPMFPGAEAHSGPDTGPDRTGPGWGSALPAPSGPVPPPPAPPAPCPPARGRDVTA